jgi:hypothetical protein
MEKYMVGGGDKTGSLNLAVAALVVLMLFGAPYAQAAFSTPLAISASDQESHVPSLAIGNDDAIHTVWAQATKDVDGNETDREVYYSKSTNGGTSFSTPVNISSTSSFTSAEPVVFVANDQSSNVHVVWEEYNRSDDAEGAEIMYSRSTNGGTSFSTPVNISNLTGASVSPSIFVGSATEGGNVHIAWTECADSNCEIYYAKSSNAGSSFGSSVNITNNDIDNDQAVIAADSGGIHLAWQGNTQAYYGRSTNGGTSFSAPQRLTSTTDQVEIEPAIIIDGGARLHIAWQNHAFSGGDVYSVRSTDGGATFGSVENRSGTSSTISGVPVLTTPQDNRVVLFWVENTSTGNEMVHTKTNNGGNTWNTPNTVHSQSFSLQEPSVVQKGNTVYLAWEDASRIYFSKE